MNFLHVIWLLTFTGLVSSEGNLKFVSDHLQGDGTTMTEMMSYMNIYGYLATPPPSSAISHFTSGEEIKRAVRMVQQVANLPQTGVLDDATSRYIKRKRCGVSDAPLVQALTGGNGRTKRFVINRQAKKWTQKTVTWRLNKSSRKVDKSSVLQELERAFRLWSSASSLHFRRVEFPAGTEEDADIVVSFESGSHGDGHRFDGQGSILAHAFPPTGSKGISGDMHMDEDEDWKTHEEAKSNRGTSVFVVAAHELGHSLGLSHSADTEALMFAGYSGPTDYDQLPTDDRRAIQLLYGGSGAPEPPVPRPTSPPVKTPNDRRRPAPNPRPVTPPSPRRPSQPTLRRDHAPARPPTSSTHSSVPQLPDICQLTFDAVAAIRGELYIFKDQYMWRLTHTDQMYGPTLTSSYWLGLPQDLERIDAAYEKQSGNYDIVLFSGNHYWVFNDRHAMPGYPQSLTSLGLPRHIERLDATLVWGHKEKTYFFSKNHYWKFDESSRRVDKDYPKEISSWEGVHYPLNSALRWKDGTTYFFQGKLFWKFNDTTMRVDHPNGKLTNSHWFNCPDRRSIAGVDTNSVNHDDPDYDAHTTTNGGPSGQYAHFSINLLLFTIVLILL